MHKPKMFFMHRKSTSTSLRTAPAKEYKSMREYLEMRNALKQVRNKLSERSAEATTEGLLRRATFHLS
jgi:predicted nuclease with TOPRIM domain